MKVELSREASAQARQIDAWWRRNRRTAPELFVRELGRAVDALEAMPGLGVRYAPKPGVRRLLLERTRYHVYFAADAERVYVIAVWSALRGRGPAL